MDTLEIKCVPRCGEPRPHLRARSEGKVQMEVSFPGDLAWNDNSPVCTAELVGSGGYFLWAMQIHWDTHRDQGGVKVYKPCLQGIPISGSVVRAQHFHY